MRCGTMRMDHIMQRPRPLYILFVATSLMILFSSSFLSLKQFAPPQNPTALLFERIVARADQACGFAGNGDIYGLGIRLGVYLQWLASILQKRYMVRENTGLQRELLDANSIFCLSIFVATILLSSGSVGPVHGVEILIMLHIFFGSTYIISYDYIIRNRQKAAVTYYGVLVLIAMTCGMSAYATWFWFSGLDRLPATSCGDFAFLFAKVALRGRARTFFKIITIVNIALWGSGTLLLLLSLAPLLFLAFVVAPFFAVGAGIERFSDWITGADVKVSARWREKSSGHGRHILGTVFGALGELGGAREQQAFFRVQENKPMGLWESSFKRIGESKKDNPIVYVSESYPAHPSVYGIYLPNLHLC